MSSTTGTVRSAFASPPAPVVSCPTQPHASGQVSSWWRAAWPPTRSWSRTASAPVERRVERRPVAVTLTGCPSRGEDPPPDPGDELEPLGVRVDEHQLVDGQHVAQPGEARRRAPGVYVEPPPTTASFMVSLSLRSA